VVLNVPFRPPVTGHFCGRDKWESRIPVSALDFLQRQGDRYMSRWGTGIWDGLNVNPDRPLTGRRH
jgi:hypothetical protein